MLVRIVALTLLTAVLTLPARSQEPPALLPLPKLAACGEASHPRLPERWRGIFLMAPFTKAQLVLADIVSDAPLSAMRVQLHGVQRGSLDFLVIGEHTYLLSSEGSAVKHCRALGDTGWRALPPDWLAPKSQCTGSTPIGDTVVDWWKSPIEPKPASYWIWSKASDRSPFRLVFQSASDRLPPLSRYAFSHQVSFEPLPRTNLADIAAICKSAKAASAASGPRSLNRALDAMTRSRTRAEREIKRLMPALDARCPATPFPTWPARLAITGMLTPFDSDENPYPTEVLYDWSVQSQRTRIIGGPDSPFKFQDSLLLNPLGYTVTYGQREGPICKAVLPGTIRPDWALRGACECAATINGRTPLSPHGTTRILNCSLAHPRAAWAWYALSGRPTTFMVTSLPGDEGSALFAVLDYHDWLPGHPFPQSVFDKPAQCRAADAEASPPAAAKRCSTCHLGRDAP